MLTTDNILKVYDGTTGALLTDVEAAPVEEAEYISVTALPDGYALLQCNDENYNTIAIQTYGGEGLLWSSAGEAQQYTYASYLTSTASGLCSQPAGTAVTAAASTMCWTWRAICFSAASAAATARTTCPTTALSRGRASTTA